MTTFFAANTLPGEQINRAYDELHRHAGHLQAELPPRGS
jgi:hypothetical protein